MGQGGATYAGAGVDIAAGDAAVERLRSLVAGIGGFGGEYPLDVSRYARPVLVASTDGSARNWSWRARPAAGKRWASTW